MNACRYQKRVIMVAVLTWQLQFLAAADCYTPQKDVLASSVAYAFFPHSSFSPTTMSTINVNVKSSSDKKFVIAIETTKTVLDLKNAIAEQTEVPAENQRLIYSGRVLKDPETLADYKIADGNTVHMVKSSGQRSK